MELFLNALLPRFLPAGIQSEVVSFRGKQDLLKKLPGRLRGLRHTMPDRIFVLLDRDAQDCRDLKHELEEIASGENVLTRTAAASDDWQLVNRIVIRELETWYFGDWEAVLAAYPKAPRNVPDKRQYRVPDQISGRSCDHFAREMKPVFRDGLVKRQAAERIGKQADPARSRSHSFRVFWAAVVEAAA